MTPQSLDASPPDAMTQAFKRLRAASRADQYPALDKRRDRLKRLLQLLTAHEGELIAAISADFSHRSHHETRLAEVMVAETGIKHALKHVKGWMAERRIKTEIPFLPGKNRLLPQPLGVVGVIAPWNYPLQLTIAPLTAALAAGNLAMLKPSELAPSYSALIARLIARYFSGDEIVVVEGGADAAKAFTALPFDHLFFTGSTGVGRMVAEAAARNLTPVTLELGGKSPAIIDASADVAVAAGRIAYGKLLNAGQTCIAPDYVLCGPGQAEPFAAAFKARAAQLYGADPANPDYTAIITQRHFDRLARLVDEAAAGGARVDYAAPNPEAWKALRKFPPCIVLSPPHESGLMREEIFGPVLPVLEVADASAAIAHVNAGERPLALYWFGEDSAARDRVLCETISGGVTVNDCLLHIAQENQPFGGVGHSGMGHYHGPWGFDAFSKLKPVFYRPKVSGLHLTQPPYGARFDRLLGLMRRFL